MGLQTVQQERARFALERVKAAAEDSRVNKGEYKSYASGLPFMIHANGLGQAAAFYRSKDKDGTHRLLYNILSEWLTDKTKIFDGHADLLEGIVNSDMKTYLAAQAEAMLFMGWIKKFAKAFMVDGDNKVVEES